MKNQVYIFNPNYQLINDKDRILLINNETGLFTETFLSFLHPVHAILFTFFTGDKKLDSVLKEVADYFQITENESHDLIFPFIENEDEVYIKYDGTTFHLPRKVIVRNKGNVGRDDLSRDKYIIDGPLNFTRRRLSYPSHLLLCINLKCHTDCTYCYADRKTSHEAMNAKKIIQIIYEAKRLGVRKFDITGGEFFLHENWEDIVSAFLACGYTPDISTKVPLSRKTIDKMVGLGLPSIQYSLDTMDSKVAAETLHVNDNYLFSLLKSIKYADSKGLEVIIKPTLSKKTCTADNVEKIVQFCKELENVKRCVVSIAGYSHFKSIDHYAMVKPDMEQIVAVENYVKKIAKHLDFPIYNDNQVFVSKELCNYKRFKDRSLCTANVDGFMVLPDGKVTICEELYWNPDFIIGDLNKMSILEMWNSPEAWNLWDLQQKTVPVNSPCSDCQDFKGCRLNKGVCWKFVLAAYGRENKFFPDPRCPKAPKINHHFIAD